MSIIDNDSNSSARNNPTLNVNDDGGVRKAHNTYGNTLRRVGSAVKQFLSFGQGTIEAKDADGNKSFFIGYDPALSTRPVIRVAKDGFDAQTGADSELVFNSEQNVFKIVYAGTINIEHAANSITSIATYNHNLGYVPAIVSYWYSATAGNYTVFPFTNTKLTGADSGKVTITGFASATTTTVEFSMDTPNYAGNALYSSVDTYVIKFYLLQETAN